jgi:hypothetical protein
MRQSGLYKRHMHRRHRLAAFLAVLRAMRRAWHRIAALHCLLRRRHGSTIDCVPRNRDSHDQEQNLFRKTHVYQTRRLEPVSQDGLSLPFGCVSVQSGQADSKSFNRNMCRRASRPCLLSQ